MLKGEDIICISWLVWDSIPLVMHHMMKRLAKKNRVLFVNPPVAYSNLVIAPRMLKGHMSKTSLWLKGVQKMDDSLFIYYPPPLLLQYGHLKLADRMNHEFTGRAIAKAARRLGFISPILWIYHPYAVAPAGVFNEKLTCYDCNDDVGFFYSRHFNKRNRLSAMEARLTERADIVFATSRYLYGARLKQNPNTHYLPSAIDVKLFTKALSSDCIVPEELARCKKPVIGFVGGMVNLKMNWQWISEAAVARPDWNFVFIGPCIEEPPAAVTRMENIIFLGPRSQEDLPGYLKGFDVCIIPYQGEEFLRACQPTKAFEYLAAGKPVVAAWIPELETNKETIRLSYDAREFIDNIEMALVDGKDAAKVEMYIRTAHGYTWDDRVENASQIIAEFLKKSGQK